MPAEKRHKTASRISPSRRRPSGSARVESTAIAGSNTRTSRPSQIRSAPRPSDLDTHPSDRHTPSHARTASGGPSSGPSTRVAGSSAKKKPVGESTASRRISTTAHEASSKASHPALASVRDKDRSGYRVKTEPSERVSAKAPAGKDYWGQPIIVKRERISLSPDEPDVAPQGDDGYEYGSDDGEYWSDSFVMMAHHLRPAMLSRISVGVHGGGYRLTRQTRWRAISDTSHSSRFAGFLYS